MHVEAAESAAGASRVDAAIAHCAHRSSADRLKQLLREVVATPSAVGLAAAALVAGFDVLGQRQSARGGTALAAGVISASLRSAVVRVERQVRNAEDVMSVLGVVGPFTPPLGTWVIEADFGQLIAGELIRHPLAVVECGSGLTTLLIAAWLKANGQGTLYTLEHDSRFADETRTHLRNMGVAEYVHMIDAPLCPQYVCGKQVHWYSPACLAELPKTIDLLVVDGPPALTPLARWPVIPLLHERLTTGAVVLVDDGRTKQASRTARRWVNAYQDLELYWHDTVKGTWRMVKTTGHADENDFVRRARVLMRIVAPHPTAFGRWPVRR